MSSKKAEARERVKAMREEQARKDRARERMMRFGIAGAVLVGIAIIAVAVVVSGGDDDGGGEVPTASTGGENGSAGDGSGQDSGSGGIRVGDPDAPVTIENWMDFLCPHCQEFEAANAEQIDKWVEAGDVNVVYNPVTYTGGVNSQRANRAFACAADEEKAAEFVEGAFAAPQQWSDSMLKDLGEELGIGGNYAQCIDDEKYDGWSSDMTDAARDNDISGTPTVFVNGEQVQDWSPQGLSAAVEKAKSEADKPADDGENKNQDGAEQGAGDESGDGNGDDGANGDGNGDNADGEEDPGANSD